MKIDELTQDEAIKGAVNTYELCINENGEAELKEVDTFYLMAQDELGDNIPLKPLIHWTEPKVPEQDYTIEDRLPHSQMSREEKRSLSPARTAMYNAAQKMSSAYERLCELATGSDVVDRMSGELKTITQ